MRTLWQRPEAVAGPPTNPAEIADRTVHRRAIEAVIWGMPAVNFELMRRQMVKVGGAANQIVFWSRPVGWKNQTLTPNGDAPAVMAFVNTREAGPVVIEIPPADEGAISGGVMDAWQATLEAVGPTVDASESRARSGGGAQARRNHGEVDVDLERVVEEVRQHV